MAFNGKVGGGRTPLLKWLVKGVAAELFSHQPLCRLVCWHLPRTKPQVALTFDDGPNPVHTRDVLDMLDKERLRATFFVLGNAIERNPGVFQDIVDAGHEIGIHGYDHTNRDLSGQTRRTLGIVSRFGVTPTLFRPPRGVMDPGTSFWMARNRMSVVLWSVDSRDSLRHERKTPINSHDSFDRIGPGDIVLMHDDNPQCLADLKEITGVLRREQLAAVSVSEIFNAA
jgi:peptidoglycan/xylan/chitin deacetylase (PgdA/CDA1 family)